MKTDFNVTTQALGHSFDAQYTAYNIGLHRLVYSVSNPRTRKGKWARGGGFLVHHNTTVSSPAALPGYTYLGKKHGGLAAVVGAPSAFPTQPPSSPSYASERTTTLPYGTVGWARARPGNQVANAFQTIYEMRQAPTVPLLGSSRDRVLAGGLRGVPGRLMRRLASFRGLGSEYLNVVFGWLPLVQDLQTMYQLTLEIDRKLDSLRRNNGRSQHRERTLLDSHEVTETATVNNGPFTYLFPTPIIIGGGKTIKTVIASYEERIWFEGRFRYFVPNIGTLEWERRAKRHLFGGGLTPVNVWKVLPWSWLIDWFSNASAVFSNMSENAVDNEVAEYAYVMRTTRRKTVTTVNTTWGARSGSPATYPAGSAIASLEVINETKSRVAASPYGFGLTASTGLTPYRAAVLAALGMSQGRFSTR